VVQRVINMRHIVPIAAKWGWNASFTWQTSRRSRRSACSPRRSSVPSPPAAGRLGCVQCHSGANERLQRLVINLLVLVEVDGTPGVAFEAGVEET
jgi:hypothetical protein